MDMPVWIPAHPEHTRMYAFMQKLSQISDRNLPDYAALHAYSIEHPESFWPAVLDFFNVHFTNPPHEIINTYTHPLQARWFTGATFNFAQVLLTRRDEHPAIVSLDEAGNREVLTYNALHMRVAQCQQGLIQAGVTVGSRVVAVLPNHSEAIIAMLATASLGAVWSSCSPDFGLDALIDRFSQIEPDILFMAERTQYMGKTYDQSAKIEGLSKALPSVKKVIICAGIKGHGDNARMQTWESFLKPGHDLQYPPLPFDQPLYILFSSGTTGKPKCIVHGAGGTLVQHLKELGLHTNIFPQDCLFFYTTCGWMMWNWMVSVLALGATLVLYDGAPTYPSPARLFDIIDNENVSVFGTSAGFLAHIEKEKIIPRQDHRFERLKTILSTGSPLLPEQFDFVSKAIKPDVQLCSISGGTDIVSCFALGNPLLPVYRGQLQSPGLGMAVKVFDEHGQSVEHLRGELVCTNAFPSMPVGFWNDPDNATYHHAYFDRFSRVWTHGDFAEITPHQGLIIYGRSDAVLNPGGVRIGTAEIYRQLASIPEINDSVVIGQSWKGDVRIVLFITLRPDTVLDETLRTTIRTTLRQHASPRHVPDIILEVSDIPKTMNGKMAEIAVRQAVQGEPIQNTHVLINPEALEYFKNRKELQ